MIPNQKTLCVFLLCSLPMLAVLVTKPAHSESLDSSPANHELQKQIEQLRQAYKALEGQLTEIRELLQGRWSPQAGIPRNLTLSVNGRPFKGYKDAKVVLVEFSDYECPYCANFSLEIMPRLEQEFISTGKLKYVRRDFPLVSLHQNAFKAAEAANCSGKQEKYWEMHARLFAHQNQLGVNQLLAHAKTIGLDMDLFEKCFTGDEEATVRHDVQEGIKVGVQGTPTLFLGVRDGESQNVKVLMTMVGAPPYPEFQQAIESILKQTNQ